MISLHGAIDDATGNVTALRFERTECLDGYFRVLKETILGFGIPRSIYSDAHSIFFSPRPRKGSPPAVLVPAGQKQEVAECSYRYCGSRVKGTHSRQRSNAKNMHEESAWLKDLTVYSFFTLNKRSVKI